MPLIQSSDLNEFEYSIGELSAICDQKLYDSYLFDLKQLEIILKSIKNLQQRKLAKTHLISELHFFWHKKLKLSISDIEQHLREINYVVDDQFREDTENLVEVLGDTTKLPNNWIVPDLLQKGCCYVFGGLPKTGKSLFTYSLIYSTVTGSKFLNRPVNPTKTYHYQLEESEFIRKKRLLYAGFGGKNCQEYEHNYFSCRKLDLTTDLNKLENFIVKNQIGLVVIDTLRASMLASGLKEIDESFGVYVGKLQKIANFSKCCILIVHHFKKDSNSRQLVQDLSGHSSISSNSDGMIGLYRSSDNQSVELITLPRDGTEIKIQYKIEYDSESNHRFLRLIRDSSYFSDPLTIQLLRFLWANQDKEYSLFELKEALGIQENLFAKFQQMINYLSDGCYVDTTFTNRGMRYSLSSNSRWMLENLSDNYSVNKKILDMQSLCSCSSYDDIQALTKDWSSDYKLEIFSNLTEDEKSYIKKLKKSHLEKIVIDKEF